MLVEAVKRLDVVQSNDRYSAHADTHDQ